MKQAGRNGGTLRPFQKGESGNPLGRPPGTDLLSELIREMGSLSELAVGITVRKAGQPDQVHTLTYATDGEQTVNALLAALLMRRAMEGDIEAIRIILDRTDGKPKKPKAGNFRRLDSNS